MLQNKERTANVGYGLNAYFVMDIRSRLKRGLYPRGRHELRSLAASRPF